MDSLPMGIDVLSKDQHIPNEKNAKHFQTTPVQNTKSSDQLGLSLSLTFQQLNYHVESAKSHVTRLCSY